MDILLLLAAVGILLFGMKKSEGSSVATDPTTTTTTVSQYEKDMERIKSEYEADLARKGIFIDVAGSDPNSVYHSYLAGHLEYVRNTYEADLRRRGWTGSLPGDTTDAVYSAYQAEYDALVASAKVADLERIRASYVGDLQRRGWAGQTLVGNSASVIYANYLREFNTLLGTKYGLTTPLDEKHLVSTTTVSPQTSSAEILAAAGIALPKFKIGQCVRTSSSGQVQSIDNWRWDDGLKVYMYRMKDHPYTWWQESHLSLATPLVCAV